MPAQRFTISCVIDAQPRFYAELVLWLTCVRRYLPAVHYRPVVYLAAAADPAVKNWVSNQGIAVVEFETLFTASPHCNKIIPFLQAPKTDYLIVTDADVFFVGDFSDYLRSTRVRAVRNYNSNPQLAALEDIAGQLNEPVFRRTTLSTFPKRRGLNETVVNNPNGGFIAVHANDLPRFGENWLQAASDLLALSPGARWTGFTDQIAFALAAERSGEDMEELSPALNCFIDALPSLSRVLGFHLTSGHIPRHPGLFAADRTLTVGEFAPSAADSVALLNQAILASVAELERHDWGRAALPTFLNPQWRR
ncbi:MAG: hypothetical protein JWR75_854 [Devosia sp.]|nr:hypothetical protein [Devosia sp.]